MKPTAVLVNTARGAGRRRGRAGPRPRGGRHLRRRPRRLLRGAGRPPGPAGRTADGAPAPHRQRHRPRPGRPWPGWPAGPSATCWPVAPPSTWSAPDQAADRRPPVSPAPLTTTAEVSSPSSSTVVDPGPQRLEVAGLLCHPGPGRAEHRTEGGAGHDDDAVDVPHHPVPERHRHAAANRMGAPPGRGTAWSPRAGPPARRTPGKPWACSAATSRTPPSMTRPAMPRASAAGGQHLTPVAPFGDRARRPPPGPSRPGAWATATWMARLSPGVQHTGKAGAARAAPGHTGRSRGGSVSAPDSPKRGRAQPFAAPRTYPTARSGGATRFLTHRPITLSLWPHHVTSSLSADGHRISISTAPPRGRAATPMAERVCRPASPNTSNSTRWRRPPPPAARGSRGRRPRSRSPRAPAPPGRGCRAPPPAPPAH